MLQICVMIYNNKRKENAGTRISIDTTVFVGDHQPHLDRLTKYSDKPPAFGTKEIMNVFKSEYDDVKKKLQFHIIHLSAVIEFL